MSVAEIEDDRCRLLEQLATQRILLWGAGPHVGSVVERLALLGLSHRVVGIFDSTRRLEQDSVCGVPVVPAEQVRTLSHDDHVVIACAGLNELYGRIVPEHLFYFRIVHRRALETAMDLDGRLDEVTDNLALLTDDRSRETYARRLRLLLASVLFDESAKDAGGPYCRNDLVEDLGGRWLYAGAYNGRHLDRVLAFDASQQIVAVEPSRAMHRGLVERFADRPQVELHHRLLWSTSDEQIDFVDDGSHQGLAASVFIPDEFGETSTVTTSTIDDLLDGRAVSDIALDVEGSEQLAIAGAKATIEQHRPRLAVCLYHGLDDYLMLPQQVLALSGATTLAVRQHSCIPLIETVLYALP